MFIYFRVYLQFAFYREMIGSFTKSPIHWGITFQNICEFFRSFSTSNISLGIYEQDISEQKLVILW